MTRDKIFGGGVKEDRLAGKKSGTGEVVPFARGREIQNDRDISSIEQGLANLREIHREVEDLRKSALTTGDDSWANELLGDAIRLEELIEKGENLLMEAQQRYVETLRESFEQERQGGDR